MDAAVYEPTTQKIYAVRGQWIFQCSTVDGSIIQSLRFSKDAFGLATITTLNGNLYVGVSQSASVDNSQFNPFLTRDIFVVNAATFTVTGALGLASKIQEVGAATPNQWWHAGYTCLANDGTLIYGWSNGGLFKVNPTNIATYSGSGIGTMRDIVYDSDHAVVWLLDAKTPDMLAVLASNFNLSVIDTGGMSQLLTGITYQSSQQKIYYVQNDFHLGMVNAANIVNLINTATNFGFTVFSTGRINANPFRIKAVNGLTGNPYNNKVLIPAWNDDTVLVWDPVSDNVANMIVKTGFTGPYDIVNCPNASFAVQTGLVGLKLI